MTLTFCAIPQSAFHELRSIYLNLGCFQRYLHFLLLSEATIWQGVRYLSLVIFYKK